MFCKVKRTKRLRPGHSSPSRGSPVTFPFFPPPICLALHLSLPPSPPGRHLDLETRPRPQKADSSHRVVLPCHYRPYPSRGTSTYMPSSRVAEAEPSLDATQLPAFCRHKPPDIDSGPGAQTPVLSVTLSTLPSRPSTSWPKSAIPTSAIMIEQQYNTSAHANLDGLPRHMDLSDESTAVTSPCSSGYSDLLPYPNVSYCFSCILRQQRRGRSMMHFQVFFFC